MTGKCEDAWGFYLSTLPTLPLGASMALSSALSSRVSPSSIGRAKLLAVRIGPVWPCGIHVLSSPLLQQQTPFLPSPLQQPLRKCRAPPLLRRRPRPHAPPHLHLRAPHRILPRRRHPRRAIPSQRSQRLTRLPHPRLSLPLPTRGKRPIAPLLFGVGRRDAARTWVRIEAQRAGEVLGVRDGDVGEGVEGAGSVGEGDVGEGAFSAGGVLAG
ncbi:hypothetical protein B0H19DRAFT_12472 [Mycena capillaripes]|nr:hypothetical protein B0H19DRAFT_12472 [Mycena capillaripes]